MEDIFVIVLTSKIIFKIGFSQILFILHDFNQSTTLTRMYAEACLLSGNSHYATFIKSCNWLIMIEVLHFT